MKLGKPHFGPVSGPFWPKNVKSRFSQKIQLKALDDTLTSCKKSENF